MIYDLYADPSHAWLKVKLSKLKELGIEQQISAFSYVRGEYAYLEEDRDLTLFYKAAKLRGESVKFREHHAEKRSKIRGYDSYQQEVV